MKKILCVCVALWCALGAFAYTERNLLEKQASIQQVTEALVMNRKWVKYPTYTDRSGWDKFLGIHKEGYIQQGEKYLNYQWKVIPATDYLAFERSGNRSDMESAFDANNRAISTLLMAELAEGKGRFVDQLINGVFQACEMTSWALPAHLITQPTHRSLPVYDYHLIDLTSGDLGGLLSWTYYFMHDSFDRINPEISRRLRHELQVRIMDAYINDGSFWWAARKYNGRMLNNWNPWCNSNVLMTFMLMEDNRDKLGQAVYLTMQSVDKFLNYIKADGACEEGPSYWGHASGKLLDYLELLYAATDGRVNIFHEKMIRDMGEYISRSYVGNGWVVNFADASAHGEGNAWLIYRYGEAVDSDEMKHFAALMFKPGTPYNGRDIFRTLESITIDSELREEEAEHIMRPFTWYPETEFCYLTTKNGLFFASKGGYNDESHNHNDIGTFSVWLHDTPVLIDAGVGTYTRQTFSSERYSIWTMQSNYHNLPQINGVPQSYGKQYKASNAKASQGTFSVDIATAYPEEAQVDSWVRTFKVLENKVKLAEKFRLKQATAPNVVNFMTWGEVEPAKGKVLITVNGIKSELTYDTSAFNLTIEPITQTDPRLSKVWGSKIYRLSFQAKKLITQGNYSFEISEVRNQ